MGIQDLGDNVRRFMKLRGLTIPALSKQIDLGTASLSNLLNGKAQPKSLTLIKLSEGLGVSIQDLLADVPKLPTLRFRTAKTLSAREKAARDQLLNTVAIWLSDYKWIEDALNNHLPKKIHDITTNNPVDAAIEVRRLFLGDNHEAVPIYDIIGLTAKAGIKLRMMPFGFRKTFGLSVGESDNGPAILVNSDSGITIERQIFTIAHELGHLILHRKSYDLTNQYDEIENAQQEAEADTFAGNLLLPDEALKSTWTAHEGLHWVHAVLRVKKIFKVSYMTVLYRLKQVFPDLQSRNLLMEFRVIYNRLYHHDFKDHYEPDAIEQIVAKDEAEGLGRSDLIEDRYSLLVFSAYKQKIINEERYAELLGMPLEELKSLALNQAIEFPPSSNV